MNLMSKVLQHNKVPGSLSKMTGIVFQSRLIEMTGTEL